MNLSEHFDKQKAVATTQFDQFAAQSIELLNQFEPEDSDKIQQTIEFFANDNRAMISLIGHLALAGLFAIIKE